MNEEIGLLEFRDLVGRTVSLFGEDWMRRSLLEPEVFPMRLAAADWAEQFMTWFQQDATIARLLAELEGE